MSNLPARLRLDQLEDRVMPSSPGDVDWVRQVGSLGQVNVLARAVDVEGNIYIAGAATVLPGLLIGEGGSDMFVRKYDAAGNEVWTRMFGSNVGFSLGDESVTSISVYGPAIYLAGSTRGTLPGQVNSGIFDAFVSKFDSDGNALWTHQFGTTASDIANTVATDATGVYVGGETLGALPGQTSAGFRDAFVRKYDHAGSELWTRQFGSAVNTSSTDTVSGMAVDASGVFVAGRAQSALPGQASGGAFLRKYDLNGAEVWTRQFSATGANGVAVSESGIFMVGEVLGALPGQTSAGVQDAFVRLYDAAGTEVWTRQFGTIAADAATGVAVDTSGVYLVGNTSGSLPSQTSAGGQDVFVRKYSLAGGELWTRQFGTRQPLNLNFTDQGFNIAADATGIYVVGNAVGPLPFQTVDGGAFVRKYDADGGDIWIRQLGRFVSGLFPVSDDFARAVDQDGNVYVGGEIAGSITSGETIVGDFDAFVSKYDAAGNVLWTRQFGALYRDAVNGIAVDASGVYVVGLTRGTIPGQIVPASTDAFVRKYDAYGNELWTRQFGSTTNVTDSANAVVVDATGVYVVGTVGGVLPGQISSGDADGFVRKYDIAGNELWTRQFGGTIRSGTIVPAPSDSAIGIAANASGVYIAGSTNATFPGQTSPGGTDAFVRHYDSAGNLIWTRQYGTAGADPATGIATDDTGLYVSGFTNGTFVGQTSAGGQDAFLSRMDHSGNELWTRQFGTPGTDQANGVATGSLGIYVAGSVTGTLPGETSAGGQDAFVRKYDSAGAVVWTGQFGTGASDSAAGVTVGASGLFLAGSTTGRFPGFSGFPSDQDLFLAKIVDEASNSPPSNVSLNLNATVDENGTATLTGSFNDPDAGDAHTVVIDWGAGEGTTTLNLDAGVTIFTATHTYFDDNPTGSASDVYSVSATVTEPTGGSASGNTTVTVSNVAPTITSLSGTPNRVGEDGTITVAGAFTDPGTQDAHTVVINWGPDEGTTTLDLASGVTTFTTSHHYADDKPDGTSHDVYLISASVTDDDTGSDSEPTAVTIENADPAVTITGPASGTVVAVGTPIELSGLFTDAGALDTHNAQWTIGAVTIAGSVTQSAGSGTVNGTLTFTEPGVYPITLTVTDDDGGTGTATTVAGLAALLVVYDPSAGFVTGGGWIDSPAGAFAANPSLTGRANLGFVAKYRHGATVPEGPDGQTEFQFKAGSLSLHSSTYEWLVVSGNKARFRGTGSVNGADGYQFELTAWDGDAPDGGGVDRFRIKIWLGNQGTGVIYDNLLGASDDSTPTALGGGSIVIHSDNLLANEIGPLGQSGGRTLRLQEMRSLLAAARARWHAAGEDVSTLPHVDLRVADLDGAALGLTVGGRIWLDRNAAGWGWFVDPTPRNDSEFTAPANQGEQHCMDLFSVLLHEIGHVLGHEHEEEGAMAETLTAGLRCVPEADPFLELPLALGSATPPALFGLSPVFDSTTSLSGVQDERTLPHHRRGAFAYRGRDGNETQPTSEETPQYGLSADYDPIRGKPQTFEWKVDGTKWYYEGKYSDGQTLEELWEWDDRN